MNQNLNEKTEKRIIIDLSKEDFIKTILSLLIKNGCSFLMFDCKYVKNLLLPYLKAFDITLNRHTIGKFVTENATLKHNQIIKRLNNRILSIKFDTTMRFGKHFISVNCQYFDTQIVCLNLSVKQLKGPGSVDNIAKYINEILKNFQIKKHKLSLQR
ncbi:hypothetical protein HERIO_2088 [Hepatospora eriocheir]|uniref:Uncharacterized protein n=1 Tax=Hepatospora eriocheir TaxID=1081669 RepID=A0A1X0Q8B8_9MICR|nr:hypothetical protein HERIO_2088 [Hepatospora eriocheir]